MAVLCKLIIKLFLCGTRQSSNKKAVLSVFLENMIKGFNSSSITQPGLWRAVQDDDLMSVRKLINLWCSVDVSKVMATNSTVCVIHLCV